MKIVIAGLGVMGASLSMAIRNSGLNATIYGYDFANISALAYERGIIHHVLPSWPADCADADVIFLATPVHTIKEHLDALNGVVSERCIVTDLGSTKVEIERYCAERRFSGTYIGSHPMTGAEKSGINAANPLLYENAVYILTAAQHTNPHFKRTLLPILEAIKARVFFLPAKEHDKTMASISHLPQMIAVALMNYVGKQTEELKHSFDLAAGGFRDLTRIASSSPEVWQDIVDSNHENIQLAIDNFIKQLEIEKGRLNNLKDGFNAASEYRSLIPKINKGFLSPLTDVLVYVTDQKGVVAKISQALVERDIDIRDIELLKIRENEGGVFMLSFESLSKATEAVDVLHSIDFKAFIKE